MAKHEITWPKNLTLNGQLSFPIKSDEEIERVVQWRLEKGIPKPDYADRIGASLFLNQEQHDRAVKYLETVYLPFAATLHGLTNGEKGIDPEVIKELQDQVKKREWLLKVGRKSKPNLPIRPLTEGDKKNAPDWAVSKIKFNGPYESSMTIKAIVKDEDGTQLVSTIEALPVGALPENANDPSALWFGAGWPFRVSLRFNAFDTTNAGVSAYGGVLYLLAFEELPVFGNSSDADVLQDGDDWE